MSKGPCFAIALPGDMGHISTGRLTLLRPSLRGPMISTHRLDGKIRPTNGRAGAGTGFAPIREVDDLVGGQNEGCTVVRETSHSKNQPRYGLFIAKQSSEFEHR
jgi:hypothetical protein